MYKICDFFKNAKRIGNIISVFGITCICVMFLLYFDAYAAVEIKVGNTVLVKDTYYKNDGSIGNERDYAFYYTDGGNRNWVADYDLYIKDLDLKGTITTNTSICIVLEGDSTITGTGTDIGEGIYINDCAIVFDGSGTLTIQNFKYGIREYSGTTYMDGGTVTIKNVDIGIYGHTDYDGVELNEANPRLIIEATTCIDLYGKFSDVSLYAGSIKLKGENAIKIGGTYNSAYLHGDYEIEATNIALECESLYIRKGVGYIKAGSYGIKVYDEIEIYDTAVMNIEATGYGMYVGGGISHNAKRLNIKAGTYGIYAEDYISTTQGETNIDTSGNALYAKNKIEIDNVEILEPEEASVVRNEGSYYTIMEDGSICADVKIGFEYALYLGGIGMNDGDYLASNAYEVSSEKPSSGGYAYYKDEVLHIEDYNNYERTLIIAQMVNTGIPSSAVPSYNEDDRESGATEKERKISVALTGEDLSCAYGLYSNFPLTIELSGDNVISSISNEAVSVIKSNFLTIQGDGRLYVRADDRTTLKEGSRCAGIETYNLDIKNCEVTVSCGDKYTDSRAIFVDNTLNIDNAKVIAKGSNATRTSYGIESFYLNINNGSTVISHGGDIQQDLETTYIGDEMSNGIMFMECATSNSTIVGTGGNVDCPKSDSDMSTGIITTDNGIDVDNCIIVATAGMVDNSFENKEIDDDFYGYNRVASNCVGYATYQYNLAGAIACVEGVATDVSKHIADDTFYGVLTGVVVVPTTWTKGDVVDKDDYLTIVGERYYVSMNPKGLDLSEGSLDVPQGSKLLVVSLFEGKGGEAKGLYVKDADIEGELTVIGGQTLGRSNYGIGSMGIEVTGEMNINNKVLAVASSAQSEGDPVISCAVYGPGKVNVGEAGYLKAVNLNTSWHNVESSGVYTNLSVNGAADIIGGNYGIVSDVFSETYIGMNTDTTVYGMQDYAVVGTKASLAGGSYMGGKAAASAIEGKVSSLLIKNDSMVGKFLFLENELDAEGITVGLKNRFIKIQAYKIDEEITDSYKKDEDKVIKPLGTIGGTGSGNGGNKGLGTGMNSGDGSGGLGTSKFKGADTSDKSNLDMWYLLMIISGYAILCIWRKNVDIIV